MRWSQICVPTYVHCVINTYAPVYKFVPCFYFQTVQFPFRHLTFVDQRIIVQFIKKNPTRCNSVSKFYYSIFLWSSTCFGWHTAHHQEPKTTLAASGFSYVEGCLDVLTGTVCAWQHVQTTTRPNSLPRMKNQRLSVQFRLLIMGGVSPEICWAS